MGITAAAVPVAQSWYEYDEGRTIGTVGSEGGSIVRDEEHAGMSRITLELGGLHACSITCGIFGWMVHTRFFIDRLQAEREYEHMRSALAGIVDSIPSRGDPDAKAIARTVSEQIEEFVERYP